MLAGVSRGLASQAPLIRDHCQVAITLCRRTRFAAADSRQAQRNQVRDAVAMRCNRLVGVVAIIGAVRCTWPIISSI